MIRISVSRERSLANYLFAQAKTGDDGIQELAAGVHQLKLAADEGPDEAGREGAELRFQISEGRFE